MRVLLILLASLNHSSPSPDRTTKVSGADPCYAVVTAIVPDSTALRVRRVVSSGVRRFARSANAGTTAAPWCAVGDVARLAELRRLVTAELARDAGGAQWITLQTTDSAAAGDHLHRFARLLNRESIIITRFAPDTDLVSARPLP